MGDEIRKMAARCWQWGANVTAIKSTGKHPYKNPAHRWTPFQTRRQTKVEAKGLGWDREDLSGCGVVCGYAGWRCIDIDDCEAFGPVEKILDGLGLPHSYRWVVKSGSGKGWHIWIRCWGALPPDFLRVKKGESGVRTGLPKKGGAFDHLEVRWERCQTLLPPSEHGSGGQYQFFNGTPENPPLEVPVERVVEAARSVSHAPKENTGEGRTAASNMRRNGRATEQAPTEGLALQAVGKAVEKARSTRERNKAGFWLACQLRDNGFSENEALRHGKQYVEAVANDKPDDEYTFDEYESSVGQAYKNGTPREPWAQQNAHSRHSRPRVNGHAENGAHSAQTAIHDSRSPKDREIVNEPEATPLFGFEKPDPLGWAVAGLIPERHVSVLAADGGTGKSFLAIFLSMCIALGRSFFGLGTRRGRVLYVDYELDTEEQQRRVWRVAEGMGLSVDDERLKERLFYFRPTAPLGTEEAHDEVMHLIEKHSIDFIVLDSLTVASAGADVTASEDVVPMMQSLREWGTVLAIDHISGNAARGNQSQATPFGSVFKRNIARSTFTLAKADGGGYLLMPDKSNFTAKQDKVCYAVEFDGESGPVTFERINATDGRMAGALSDMDTYDVTLTAIEELTDDDHPVMPEEIVKWREEHDVEPIKKGTIRNHFTTLKKDGKIELDGGGALLITHDFHAPSSIHDGNEMNASIVNEENRPQSTQPAKKPPADPSFTASRPLRDRESVNDPGHSVPTVPALQRKQRVTTPKGAGHVVKVEDRTVSVELENARIGETTDFDLEDVEPL